MCCTIIMGFLYALIAAGLGTSALLNYATIKLLTDPHEYLRLVMIIQLATFTLVQLHAFLLPFDTESVLAKNLGENFDLDVDNLYKKIELALMIMMLAGLPFSYFYAMEVQETEQMQLFAGKSDNEDLEGEQLLLLQRHQLELGKLGNKFAFDIVRVFLRNGNDKQIVISTSVVCGCGGCGWVRW